jgi:hypothetical protein
MTPPIATLEDSYLIKLAMEGEPGCFGTLMDRHLIVIKTLRTSRDLLARGRPCLGGDTSPHSGQAPRPFRSSCKTF